MKNKLIIALLSGLFTMAIYGQAPQKVKYQAVVRNASNDVVSNQSVGIEIEILQGTINGTSVLSETFSLATNIHGLVNMNIGEGNNVTGDFSQIEWGNGPYFIQTSIDITGGTNYVLMGVSELLSVPYALYSEHSASADTANFARNTGESDNYYFSASTGFSGQSIPGTNYTEFANFGEEILDPSASYDPATSTFTAPVDGVYSFNSFMTVSASTANSGGVFFGFIVNNATFPNPSAVPTSVISPAEYLNPTVVPLSGILSLSAGDTVRIGLIGSDNGEAFNLSYSYISGYKIR